MAEVIKFWAKYKGSGEIGVISNHGKRTPSGVCEGCPLQDNTHIRRSDGTAIGYSCTGLQKGVATLTFRGVISRDASRDTAVLTGCGVKVYETIESAPGGRTVSNGVVTQAKAKEN